MALGWLRASHRKLSDSSTELVPAHPHDEAVPLTPGEPVKLAIEIWPIGNSIKDGETLRLVISGSDIYRFDTGAPEMGHVANNKGAHRILTGDAHASYLALPALPES
jgi:predicted acyl esterase